MNAWASILARDEVDVIEFVVILVILAIGGIAGAIQKARQKKAEQEAAEGAKRETGQAPPQRPAPRPQQRPQRRPVPQQQPPPRPAAPEPVRVRDELRIQQQRRRQIEAERARRLAAPKSPQADTAAIEERVVSVEPAQGPAPPVPSLAGGLDIGLLTPANARRAIVMHEILAPPKALRRDAEIWDL